MSDNENIEAKLCSYVEGDLDAEGRAEIEKYLLANPQYLPLLKELSRTRGLLRDLPRAPAPAELLETLSGQIERSALLGSDDPASMRIQHNRTPHLAAWAAVLLLMTGLAAVVYRVLPANKTPPEVALLKAAPPQPSTTQSFASEFQKLPDQETQVAMSPAEKDQLQAPMAAPSIALPAPAVNDQPLAEAKLDTAAAPQASMATAPAIASATVLMDGNSAGNRLLAQQGTSGPIVGGDATRLGQNMYVTLHAIDAKVANERLTAYLNDKQIAFESRADSSVGMADASQFSNARRRMATTFSFAKDSSALSLSSSSDALKKMGSPTSNNALEGFDPAQARAATTMPLAVVTAFSSTGKPATADDSNNIIIAHNLSPQQVKSLTDDLAIHVAPADQKSVASTQPAATLLRSGDALHIVARDNSLPGVEAMDEQQTIDGDGNVTLPLVGKIKAAGLSEAQLAGKIPQAYRDAKSPTTATWGIDRVSPAVIPATAPTTDAVPSVVVDAGDALPSTAPAGVDVTIRVVAQSVAATLPTTQLSTGAGDNAVPVIPSTDPATTMPEPAQ